MTTFGIFYSDVIVWLSATLQKKFDIDVDTRIVFTREANAQVYTEAKQYRWL